MLVVLDAAGHLVHANVQATQLLGWEPGDDPVPISRFIHPDDREATTAAFELFVGGEVASRRHRLRVGRGDGQWTWVEVVSRNRLGEEIVDGVVISARDVTDQVDAERQLMESEQRFRSLVSASADAIVMMRVDGTVVYRSEHSEELLGAASTGGDLLAVIHPDDRDALRAAVVEASTGPVGTKARVASRVRRDDGYVWYESWIVNQIGVPGVDSLVVYGRDVTARRAAEEALRSRVAADELVARISARFVEVGADEIEEAVRDALGELGANCDADRAWIFNLTADGRYVEHAYEWCAPGIRSEIDNMRGVAIGDLPGFATWIGNPAGPLVIPSVDSMDESLAAEREILRAQGIRSLAGQAMFVKGELYGLVGLDAVREERHWSDQVVWALGACANVFGSALRRCEAETALALNEARFRAMFDQAADGVRVVDADMNTVYASPAVARITGYTLDDLRDPGVRLLLVHPDDRDLVEEARTRVRSMPGARLIDSYRMLRPDGSWVYIEESSTNLLDDPAVQGIVMNMRDVTERRRYEEELVAQARRDPLTGLANRLLFDELLAAALARAQVTGSEVAVVAIDLDRFKRVNDSLGHHVGDSVLQQTAARLRAHLRGGDLAARVGSDEFVVLVEPVEAAALDELTERLVAEFGEPFVVDGRPVYTTASIGVSVADGAVDAATVMRRADAALDAAKSAGGNRVRRYDDELVRGASDKVSTESDLRAAVTSDQLRLHYQPIVSVADGSIVGAEALLRWQHPTRGLLLPGEFLDVAEETGVISTIGAWVVRDACRQLAEWRDDPCYAEFTVQVNVSVRQLRDGGLADTIEAALAATGVEPDRFCIEITESALLSGAEAIAELEAVQQLGVKVALDDFGTGHSSLSYLRRLAIDVLKIDREFVDGLTEEGSDAAIVTAIVGLARSLGLGTVAEGVETEAQADALRELGCEHAQGFWYSPPLTVAEFGRFVATHGRRR